MPKENRIQNYALLGSITAACLEIQQVLQGQLQTATSHKEAIEKDIVTLENLKSIVFAVKNDIEQEKNGSCTELLLRITAKEFKKKLALIPERKDLKKEIIRSLREVHKNILSQTN